MEEMIIALQQAVAHQGEDISHLSDELYIQQEEIARLRIQVKELNAKLQAAADDGSGTQTIDQEPPPPHY